MIYTYSVLYLVYKHDKDGYLSFLKDQSMSFDLNSFCVCYET